MGSRLRVLQERDDGRWLRILAPDGTRAWVRSWGTAAVNPLWPVDGVFVTSTVAKIRARPARDAAVLVPVTMGCRLQVLPPRRRGYRRVATPDGRSGWIDAASLAPDSLPASAGFWIPMERRNLHPDPSCFRRGARRSLLARGRTLLGVAYRWGGTSPLGLDCSGLVRLLFGLEGIVLPRDSRDQALAMRPFRVPTEMRDVKAGDLVFFGSRDGVIDHVGIGIGGGSGRFLHASGRVRISSLVVGDPLYEETLASRLSMIARPSWTRL